MFAGFMIDAWIAGTIVAVVAGVIGVFVVFRGDAFLAHAIPHGAFAGAAGAVLVGLDPLLGLGLFAAGGSVVVAALSRRSRGDVAIALTLATMLGLGALFLSRSTEYSAEIFSLLFGQVLGVSTVQIVPMLILGTASLVAVGLLYRPLLLASALPDTAPARGVRPGLIRIAFGLIVACATTTSVPVVGALLMFALLVGPPAAASALVRRPSRAIALSVVFSLVTVWAAIALAYETDLPVGFFVTAVAAVLFGASRIARARGRRRSAAAPPAASAPPVPVPAPEAPPARL